MATQNLKRIIRKKLLVRLALACLAISFVLSVISWALERDRVSQVVIERARQSVKRFNLQVLPLLDAADQRGLEGEDLLEELREFRKGSIAMPEGQFVLVCFYDTQGAELLRVFDENDEHRTPLDVYMDGAGRERPEEGREWFKIVRIEGEPFIHVSEPMFDSGGLLRAYIEGVFEVSDAEIAAVNRRMIRSALFGIGIVFITALLIYPLITTLLGRLSGLTTRLLDANLETISVLGSAIAKRDSDTDAHNFRVTVYSARIAEEMGLDSETMRTLIKGAFLHDVGKIGIRDNVLLKPGKLTDEEYEVMKRHVNHGLDIVERSDWLDDAREVVGSHHEKFDGTGYDRGLKGEEIPVTARIFAIADVFDAVASKRPYKEPYSFDETMEILEAGRGTHFDPRALDAFSEIARPLYDKFANSDVEVPRAELTEIVRRYFQKEVAELT